MEYCRGRDFLFCDLCGNLLSLNSLKYAECNSCGFKRNVKEIVGKETCYTVTAEDIRRELNIEPFVQLDGTTTDEGEVNKLKRATVNDACPKCGHAKRSFHTSQLRSADEGQTVFYECPNCGHKESENT